MDQHRPPHKASQHAMERQSSFVTDAEKPHPNRVLCVRGQCDETQKYRGDKARRVDLIRLVRLESHTQLPSEDPDGHQHKDDVEQLYPSHVKQTMKEIKRCPS